MGPMRRLVFVLLAVAPLAQAPAPADSQTTHPFAGVTYVDRTESRPRRVHMHVVQVDLGAPGVRFELSRRAGQRETIRQTTLDFLKAGHAQVAVNAHFFLPFPSADPDAWLIGIAASDGFVYSTFEAPEQNFAIVADAPGLNIDRANHASIVHRDPNDAAGRRVRERVALWTTVSGSAQIVTDGQPSVPEYRDPGHPNGLLVPAGSLPVLECKLLVHGRHGPDRNRCVARCSHAHDVHGRRAGRQRRHAGRRRRAPARSTTTGSGTR